MKPLASLQERLISSVIMSHGFVALHGGCDAGDTITQSSTSFAALAAPSVAEHDAPASAPFAAVALATLDALGATRAEGAVAETDDTDDGALEGDALATADALGEGALSEATPGGTHRFPLARGLQTRCPAEQSASLLHAFVQMSCVPCVSTAAHWRPGKQFAEI